MSASRGVVSPRAGGDHRIPLLDASGSTVKSVDVEEFHRQLALRIVEASPFLEVRESGLRTDADERRPDLYVRVRGQEAVYAVELKARTRDVADYTGLVANWHDHYDGWMIWGFGISLAEVDLSDSFMKIYILLYFLRTVGQNKGARSRHPRGRGTTSTSTKDASKSERPTAYSGVVAEGAPAFTAQCAI